MTRLTALLAFGLSLTAAEVQAQDVGLNLADLLEIDIDADEPSPLVLYGFVRSNVERVFNVPSVEDGKTVKNDDPLEWSFPGLHLYGTARATNKVSIGFNILVDGEGAHAREGYIDLETNKMLVFRFGQMYRRFGLYNEKLDQFPTFVGIEPPELFDKDHLLLPRSALFAIHGQAKLTPEWTFKYRLDTGNGEAGPEEDVYPLGMDLRVQSKRLLAGVSGYFSSITSEKSGSTVGVGDGSPKAGILPWMAGDKYFAATAYIEVAVGRLLAQLSYSRASHDAERDPESVLAVAEQAGINERMRKRFFGSNNMTPTAADVVTDGSYTVQSAYLRVSYNIPTKMGAFIPYGFIDWMSSDETIGNKAFGGDNEMGVADDGAFWKPSLGLAYKPKPTVALKFDSSAHIQEFNGKTEIYPEARFDISVSFKGVD